MRLRSESTREVLAFGLISFFSDLAHEAVSAVMPLVVLTLGGPPALALGLVEGVSDAVASVCKLVGGRLADRLPRLKPPTAAGYAVTAVTIPLIGFATSWAQVLVLRSVAWCGKGFRSPLRDTLLVRAVPAESRGAAFGLERAMDQLGAVMAPLLVIVLLRQGMAVGHVVLLSIIPGVLCVTSLLTLVREQPRARAADGAPAAAPSLPPITALPSSFRQLLLALFVFGSGDFSKTLLILWSLGVKPDLSPTGSFTLAILLYAAFNLVTVGAAFIGGRLSDRLGRRPVLVFGYALGVVSALVPVFFAQSLPAGAVALFFAGLLVGIEEAVERAWAADLTPEGKRGRAFGYVHVVNGVGDMIASVLLGLIWTQSGPIPAFAVAALLMAAGTLLASRLRSDRAAPPLSA